MSRHFMNPQHGKHMGEEEDGRSEDKGSEKEKDGGARHPSIHVHSHSKGHTVHIMHPDGGHEKHEHSHGDAEGIAAHVHKHIGGKEGQDHGFSSGEDMEDEHGFGPGV